jgi:hypothetical protein
MDYLITRLTSFLMPIIDLCLSFKFRINKLIKQPTNYGFKVNDIHYCNGYSKQQTSLKKYSGDFDWKFIEEYIGNSITDKCHVEIKYDFDGQKYRLIFLKDNPIIFPPYKDTDLRPVHSADKKILLAVDTNGIDITNTLHEYAGPLQDFHNGVVEHINIPSIAKQSFSVTDEDLEEFVVNDSIKLSDELVTKLVNSADTIPICNDCLIQQYSDVPFYGSYFFYFKVLCVFLIFSVLYIFNYVV